MKQELSPKHKAHQLMLAEHRERKLERRERHKLRHFQIKMIPILLV